MKILITGTSKGIGKNLAEGFLARNHQVIGVSRNQSITDNNYKHYNLDLADIDNFDISQSNLTRSINRLNQINHVYEEIKELEIYHLSDLKPKQAAVTPN